MAEIVTAGQKKEELSTANFITIAVIVTFVVVVVSGLLLKGRVQAYQLNSKVSAKKAVAVKNLQDDLTAYNSLEDTYQVLVSKEEDKLILDALPTEPDITGLAAALDSQASQSGVQISSVSSVSTAATTAVPTTATTAAPAALTTNGAPVPMNVSLTATGSYVQIMAFLKTIEQSARPIAVSSITLGGDSKISQASMSLLTYYAPAAKPQMTTEAVK